MTYEFIDGFRFQADTAEDICKALWYSMHFKLYNTLKEWMNGNAKVMKSAYGIKLRTDTPAHHVDDMLKNGIIKKL